MYVCFMDTWKTWVHDTESHKSMRMHLIMDLVWHLALSLARALTLDSDLRKHTHTHTRAAELP